MAKLTDDQARIRSALNKFPFGGTVQIHYLEAEQSSDEMFARIADTLENLSAAITYYTEQSQQKEAKLSQLEHDVAAMRRVLGIGGAA